VIAEKEKHFRIFEKKIVPYLDGALSSEERSEFEAFVLTHPEFEEKIKNKKIEVELIQQMIPYGEMSKETLESIDHEFRTSIFNLLKEEPRSWTDHLKLKFEDWFNR
jgi:hypothetical protein